MTFIVATLAEARALAAELRQMHADPLRHRIERPLFDGDTFRVVVG